MCFVSSPVLVRHFPRKSSCFLRLPPFFSLNLLVFLSAGDFIQELDSPPPKVSLLEFKSFLEKFNLFCIFYLWNSLQCCVSLTWTLVRVISELQCSFLLSPQNHNYFFHFVHVWKDLFVPAQAEKAFHQFSLTSFLLAADTTNNFRIIWASLQISGLSAL